MPFGSKIEVKDYEQQFTRIRPGVIRSHSTHTFKFGENSLSIPIIIEQTIEYNECQYKPYDERQSTIQLTVARNFIVYDNNEQIVRYASNSRTNHFNQTGLRSFYRLFNLIKINSSKKVTIPAGQVGLSAESIAVVLSRDWTSNVFAIADTKMTSEKKHLIHKMLWMSQNVSVCGLSLSFILCQLIVLKVFKNLILKKI